MRRVMRVETNEEYWDRRWREARCDADSFDDLRVYPIRYAEMLIGGEASRHRGIEASSGTDSLRVLEIGCGLGRVLKHYHRLGIAITGLERSSVAVAQLQREDASLDVVEGDVRVLPFADDSFDVILAFGVYHNLEEGMDESLAETARCLKPAGRFCASMRPDNLEMRLNEWYWRRQRKRSGAGRDAAPRFHKLLVKAGEFKAMLAQHGLHVDEMHQARNVSLLYRVPMLRARQVDEAARRAQGYRLNAIGRAIDGLTTILMPGQRANVLVFIGQKVKSPQRRRERRDEELVAANRGAERVGAPVMVNESVSCSAHTAPLR